MMHLSLRSQASAAGIKLVNNSISLFVPPQIRKAELLSLINDSPAVAWISLASFFMATLRSTSIRSIVLLVSGFTVVISSLDW